MMVNIYNVNAQKAESRVSKSQNNDKDSKVYELMKTCPEVSLQERRSFLFI